MATSVKIDDDLKRRLERLSVSRRRSPHGIMRKAIQHYVEREEAVEDFREEAGSSWADYRDTGLYLTGDEVRTWLATWGTGDETDMPACHS